MTTSAPSPILRGAWARGGAIEARLLVELVEVNSGNGPKLSDHPSFVQF
ncbi:hypothetical protein [Magnetospirillum moscoviense]|nr:hypothetical protein [Magnetospirillum moscoviense]